MRDAGIVRTRTLEILRSMLHRPSMYGAGQGYECAIRERLADVAYIDEREDELTGHFEELEHRGLWGALGTWGALAQETGRHELTDEIASVYARVASRMGYFSPQRHVVASDWNTMANGVETWARSAPRSGDDVREKFGLPSYSSLSREPRVLSYAAEGDVEWISFDFPNGSAELGTIRLDRVSPVGWCIDLRKQGEEPSPEETYRAFLVAVLSGDRDEIAPFLLTGTNPDVLWAGAYPADVASLLSAQYRKMSVVRIAAPDSEMFLISDGCPVPLRLVRTSDGWRVDPEALVQMRRHVGSDAGLASSP